MWYIYPVKDYSRGMQISEFKGSLVYRVISRTARAIQGDPVPKKKKKKKKKNKKQKQTKKDHSAIQNEDVKYSFQENAWK